MADPSEVAKRIQSIVNTLEQKKADVERAQSDINRLKIWLDKSIDAMMQTRRQLIVELAKLDPDGFEWIARQALPPVPRPELPVASVSTP